MPYKLGDQVQQVPVELIKGVITQGTYNVEAGIFQWEVTYLGEDGQPTTRWFDDNQIQPQEQAQ